MDCKQETQLSNSDEKLQDMIVKMMQDETISRLLHYDTRDALYKPPLEDPYILLGTKIYKLRFRPPSSETSTILCAFFSDYKADTKNPYIKHGDLEVIVATHRDLWDIDDGKTRVMQIIGALDNILNKNYLSKGLNKEFFRKAKYYDFNEVYSGYIITYSGVDAQ